MMRYGRHRAACPDRHGVCDFQVIGELKADPRQLLLLGDDGQCYAMDVRIGEVTPLEPDDTWAVDLAEHATARAGVRRDRLAS